jgi:hypothetical protein
VTALRAISVERLAVRCGGMEAPRLTVPDHELARLVARDLEQALARRGSELPGPFYAVTLWVDEVYGYFAFNTADQIDYELRRSRATGYAEHELNGPAFRWYSGEWNTTPEEFVSAETAEVLAPLAAFVKDDSIDIEAREPVWQRWHAIAYDAARQVSIPPNLATTADCLLFVERDDIGEVDIAEDMLRTVPPARLHEVIPGWRLLAVAVEEARADPTVMAWVRDQAAADAVFPKTAESVRFPAFGPVPNDLTAHLRSCGLLWGDLANWSDRLQRALAIAHTTGS